MSAFISWLTWIAGTSGLGVGLILGHRLGSRRGGAAWSKAYMLGGAAGFRSVAYTIAIHGIATREDCVEAARLIERGASR